MRRSPARRPPRSQAELVDYELHTLGWKAFQNLCQTIISESMGQTVEGFFDSNDGGRDGAFRGTWCPQKGEEFSGNFTIQCKFTSDSNHLLKASEVADEISKAVRLCEQGLAETYLLFTNARVTGKCAEKLRDHFSRVPGLRQFAIYGGDRITRFIKESARLRMLVPRVYGIGDLSQIMDERAMLQAKEILSSIGSDLQKFVFTDAYRRSADALVKHGFVLLLGEPACGKSTIAAALAMGAIDEWGCSTFNITNAKGFIDHSNPVDNRQFFWVDDAFGSTQFLYDKTTEWNSVFMAMNAAIKRGAKVLFTSRSYIYRQAKKYLKESSIPVMREAQVVIEVEKLSSEEREQILYNHIKLGSQKKSFKTQVRPLLLGVAHHAKFSPEIARRLANPAFTKNIYLDKFHLDSFVARPMELLREVIESLDSDCLSALALVFMRGGNFESPIEMSLGEKQAIELIGGSTAGVIAALKALDDSMVVLFSQGDRQFWKFKHPTIRDAFSALVAENRELMDVYLAGVPLQLLIYEVTCGDVGIEGAKVVVPPQLFDTVSARLESALKSEEKTQDSIYGFLSFRCSCDFLSVFLRRNKEFVAGLRVGAYLTAVSDVRLLGRLHEFNLLSEDTRKAVVAAIGEIAIDTPDSGFMRKGIKGLFTDQELIEIMEEVRRKVMPSIPELIDSCKNNYFSGDVDSHFEELESTIKDFGAHFENSGGELLADKVRTGLDLIAEAITEIKQNQDPDPESVSFPSSKSTTDTEDASHSIFDDVDV